MKERFTIMIREIGTIFLRKVVVGAAILSLLVGLSFLFTKDFNMTRLSERLVWTGLGVALLGGFFVFGQTTGGRSYGLPGIFTRTVHANDLINFNIEARKNIQGKFDWTIQMFLIGLLLFLLGILVDLVLV